MKSSVTNRQMFFLLFLTLTSYTAISIPKVIAQGPGTGGWSTLMVTALIFAAFVAMIVRLNNAFPGMMLFDYSERIVGKVPAYIIAVFFVLYFLLVSLYLNMQLIAVLKAEFYPKTPHFAMLVVSVIVFGMVAYRGITSVGRFFEVIGTVFLITAVATHLVMMSQGSGQEIQPFFRLSKLREYALGIKDVVIAFLGIELLTIFPLGGKNIGRSVATASLSVLFVGLFYVFVVETCIMMLGMQSIQNYNFALIEAIKQIDNPILERFDILYLTVGFAGLVAGVCGVYLAVVEYAARLLKKLNRIVVVIGVGVLIVVLSIAAHAVKTAMDIFEAVLPVAGLVASFVIPALLLLIAKVRGFVEKPQKSR